MDAPTFRQQFPEFLDPAEYPDPSVNFWLGLGATLLPADRWGDTLDYGLSLFTAHHLAIAARDEAAAAAGGVPGEVKGVVTSKTVDKVSVSYDAGSVSMEDAGFWNMTTYGIKFFRLARLMGAGGIQL